MEGVNETEELDVDVLFTNLIMLQPFYYGCEDPLDLDPSLEGILMRDSSSRAEHPDEETVASGTEFGSAVPAPEIGLVLFRGECSFVAKVRALCRCCSNSYPKNSTRFSLLSYAPHTFFLDLRPNLKILF